MYTDLNMMIQAFDRLNIVTAKTEQTFMQLTDYPHLENVCSNVLAFFFNTEETHDFGSLFIRSLLECAGVDINCRSTEIVEREVLTEKGNRIDIFIETDKHLIAIENKVFSSLNNPLGDYEAHINRLNKQGEKKPVFILLTIHSENAGNSAFVNVTYSMLLATIRKNLGAYVVNANTKWIVILNDFIRTIDELHGGVSLDREFIDFYNENEKAIDTLLKARKALPKSLKAKLQSIMNMVSFDSTLAEGTFSVSYDDCSAEYYLTNNDVKQIGAPVHWVIYADTKECDILVGIDGATENQKKLLEKSLLDRKLEYLGWEGNGDYYRIKKYDVFEADKVIAQEFQSLLNSLN